MAFLAAHYILILPFMVCYSVLINVPIVKHLVWLLYLAAMVWTPLQSCISVLQPNLLHLGLLCFILIVMQSSQAYMLAQELNALLPNQRTTIQHFASINHKWLFIA